MLQSKAMTSPTPTVASPPYGQYAAFYDRSGQIHFAVLTEIYLLDIIREFRPPGLRLLDLACGTGTLAIMFAKAGWTVTGLDRSSAMLDEAEGKRQAAGVDV